MDEMRKDFEEAFTEHQGEETEAEAPEAKAPEIEADGGGSEEPEPVAEVDKAEIEPVQSVDKEAKIETAPKAPEGDDKAPQSWSPKAREGWKGLSVEAKAQINKREKEVNTVLQQSAQARQAMQQLNQVLEPYRNGLIASGINDPIQAIGSLFRTEAQLRSGNTQQRATMVANLIKQYGVDIGVLDSLLAGEAPQDHQSSALEQMLEQRLAPVNQFLQQQQYTQQQQEYQQRLQANQSVQQFSSSAEFINDVRADMADLLDMASARGQSMTLQQAYQKACAINPEVSAILSERERQQKIMGTSQVMADKRNAAASIRGVRGGNGGKLDSSSLRDELSQAWDAHGG